MSSDSYSVLGKVCILFTLLQQFAESSRNLFGAVFLLGFFQKLGNLGGNVIVKVYNRDHLSRHVVFSTLDNVKRICSESSGDGGDPWIEPLEDGSICPHFTAKGRAGEYAMKLLENVDGLTLTLLTLPFLHSNFLGFVTPLPNEGGTQWAINACFGEDSAIDMLSVSDLSHIVRK